VFTIIATIHVDPASAAHLEQVFAEFIAVVRANEPGTIAFHLAREPGIAGGYRVIEIYQDEAALEFHKAAAAFTAFRPMLGSMLLSPPTVERLDVAL
jgi:quinol monooxygenase YgiN